MITRFAPSPTGPLHLGHAFSALLAHDAARAAGGAFRLRIDDLDQSRARPDWEDLIYTDLDWLGIRWDGPVRRQSEHFDEYAAAVDRLTGMGLTFPCACTRRDVDAAASAPQEGAPGFGPDGRIYPGTCRGADVAPDAVKSIRLNMGAACAAALPAHFTETGAAHTGRHELSPNDMTTTIGDVVLVRPGMAASYHLAVVLDDKAQGVTHVIRGEDLFDATRIHVLLQRLLDAPSPVYHHHRLIRDDSGKRLAKRDDARAIRLYRDQGCSPSDIRHKVGLDRQG